MMNNNKMLHFNFDRYKLYAISNSIHVRKLNLLNIPMNKLLIKFKTNEVENKN